MLEDGAGVCAAAGDGRWGGCPWLWPSHGYQQLEKKKKKKAKLWLMRAFSSRLSGSEVAVLRRPYPCRRRFPLCQIQTSPLALPSPPPQPPKGSGRRQQDLLRAWPRAAGSSGTTLPFGMQISLLRAWGAWGHGGRARQPPAPRRALPLPSGRVPEEQGGVLQDAAPAEGGSVVPSWPCSLGMSSGIWPRARFTLPTCCSWPGFATRGGTVAAGEGLRPQGLPPGRAAPAPALCRSTQEATKGPFAPRLAARTVPGEEKAPLCLRPWAATGPGTGRAAPGGCAPCAGGGRGQTARVAVPCTSPGGGPTKAPFAPVLLGLFGGSWGWLRAAGPPQ